jgi:hypothetical protein
LMWRQRHLLKFLILSARSDDRGIRIWGGGCWVVDVVEECWRVCVSDVDEFWNFVVLKVKNKNCGRQVRLPGDLPAHGCLLWVLLLSLQYRTASVKIGFKLIKEFGSNPRSLFSRSSCVSFFQVSHFFACSH